MDASRDGKKKMPEAALAEKAHLGQLDSVARLHEQNETSLPSASRAR
jgi:hypothetical protein